MLRLTHSALSVPDPSEQSSFGMTVLTVGPRITTSALDPQHANHKRNRRASPPAKRLQILRFKQAVRHERRTAFRRPYHSYLLYCLSNTFFGTFSARKV